MQHIHISRSSSDITIKKIIAISYFVQPPSRTCAQDGFHNHPTPQREMEAREMTSGAFQCFYVGKVGHGG
jgi:hypothetical protein